MGALIGADHIPLWIQLMCGALFGCAAVALAGRASHRRDRVLPWYAAAALALALSRLVAVLAEPRGDSWLALGDLVALAAAALLLDGRSGRAP